MENYQRNVAHILNLISMALAENDFDEKEKALIAKIATRLGLRPKDIEEALISKQINFVVPNSIAERIQHLHDLVLVMLADGIIHPEEIVQINRFTKLYGFEDKASEYKFEFEFDRIANHLSFQRFLEYFRTLTAEKLSSILVDKDFNVSFPAYGTQLLNAGPLPRALYVFFLLQNEPIEICDLSDTKNKELLIKIYSLIPGSEITREAKIERLTNPDGLGFNEVRTRLNSSIRCAMPGKNSELADNYMIVGSRNQSKSVKLDKNLINILKIEDIQ